MTAERLSRQDNVNASLARLTDNERALIKKAADGKWEGGDHLEEPFRSRATAWELVYSSSGRLRTDVLKIFLPDKPVFVTKKR